MASQIQGAAALAPQRRYDIDWLRIAAVLLLIPFHSARVFDTWETWYIKNRALSRGLSGFVSFVSPWHMSLLFLLAGSGTWLAMRHRSGRGYAGERFKRLGVPLFFGVLVIVPPQTWIGFITHGQGYESFLASYKRYWTHGSDGLSGYAGGWTPGHLWFIWFLLMLALLALPLFLSLRGGRGRRVVEAFARAAHRPAVLMLPAIGLMLAWALTIQFDFLNLSGQNPLGYLLLLIFGFMLVADQRITAAIAKHWVWMLPAGLACMGIMVAFSMGGLPWAGGNWGGRTGW
jgi:glucan biosynthesis protein C